MKKIIGITALVAAIVVVVWGKFQPPPERLQSALAEAKRDNKLVLLDFTGSDWCGWCMKLEEESLGKPEFIDYASKYLVTVIVDFPMHHDLPAGLKKANSAIKSKYGVGGFPTLIALSPDGKVVWQQTGYVEGGPFGIIAPLNRTRLALGMPPAEAGPTPAVTAQAKPEPAPVVAAPIITNVTVAKTATATNGLTATAPKLQGIFYSRSNPSVILNGHQCGEGDFVGGMKVVKILRNKVTVEWEGRTRDLTMN